MGTTWAADRWTYDWMHVCLTGWIVGWLVGWEWRTFHWIFICLQQFVYGLLVHVFPTAVPINILDGVNIVRPVLQQRRDGFVVCSFALKTIGQLARRQSVPVLGAGGCTTDSWSHVTVDSPLMIHCCCRWVQEINMKGHGCWFLFSRVETHTHTNILVIQLKSFYFYIYMYTTNHLSDSLRHYFKRRNIKTIKLMGIFEKLFDVSIHWHY